MSHPSDPYAGPLGRYVEVPAALSDAFPPGMVVILDDAGTWTIGTGPTSDITWARREIARIVRGGVRRILGALR